MIPVMRGDMEYLAAASDKMESIQDDLTGVTDESDFLTGIYAARATADLMYFSRFIAFTSSSGSATIKNETYTTGTISGTSGASVITGVGTGWVKNAWPGYILYQTHHSDNAFFLPNVQEFAGNLIYNAVRPIDQVVPDNICGPFHAAITNTAVEYTTNSATANACEFLISYGGLSVGADSAGYSYATDGTGASWSNATWAAGTAENLELYGCFIWAIGRYLYRSIDGANWTEVYDFGASWTGSGFASNGSRHVVIRTTAGADSGRYSDDDGVTWTDVDGGGYGNDLIYTGYKFISVANSGVIMSGDGEVWRRDTSGTSENLNDSTTNGLVVVVVGANGTILTGTARSEEWTLRSSVITGTIYQVEWDGTYFWAVGDTRKLIRSKDGVDWEDIAHGQASGNFRSVTVQSDNVLVGDASTTVYRVSGDPATRSTDIADFRPVSTDIRAQAFSVSGAYLTMFGTLEYDKGAYTYNPRRMRWPVPGTTTDFTGVGSGFKELPGFGACLDARSIGTAVMLFESDRISVLKQKASLNDPFSYQVLRENVRTVSNAIVTKSRIFFVGQDGLLWVVSPSTIQQLGEFDLTEFEDDWDDSEPVQLSYSTAYQSLVVYVPNSAATAHKAWLVNPETHSISYLEFPEFADGESTMYPRAVWANNVPWQPRLYISYEPISGDPDQIVVCYIEQGSSITGVDSLTAATTKRWHALLETGELHMDPKGRRLVLREVEVETYTSGGSAAKQPAVGVEVQNAEDSDWRSAGDTTGTITAGTAALKGTSTVYMADSDYPTGTCLLVGGTATTVIDLPWLATQISGKAYVRTAGPTWTAYTDYTVSGVQQITLGSAFGAGSDLWVFPAAAPHPKLKAGDLVETTQGLHRVATITANADTTNATSGTLEWYPSSELTGSHIPAKDTSDGESYLVLGTNVMIDGVRVRIYLVPQNDSSNSPDTIEVTGMVLNLELGGDTEVKGD
jgi:hypothetical protein